MSDRSFVELMVSLVGRVVFSMRLATSLMALATLMAALSLGHALADDETPPQPTVSQTPANGTDSTVDKCDPFPICVFRTGRLGSGSPTGVLSPGMPIGANDNMIRPDAQMEQQLNRGIGQ